MKQKNLFSYYAEYGFYCIPTKQKSKKPIINWKAYVTVPPSDSHLENWDKGNFGMGLLLGKISNCVAIDIDDLEFADLVPKSPVVKIGARGETRFFKYNGEPNRNYKGLEIKSTGTYTIIPPSIHPDGMAYTWTSGDLTQELPDLPKDLIEKLDIHFNYTKREKDAQSETGEVFLPDVEDALKYINPESLTYDEWLKIGMALKTTYGQAGFNIWDSWSKPDKRYKQKEMPRKWSSFNLNEVTVATIFFYAEKEGFNIPIPEFTEIEPTPPKTAPKLPIDDIIDQAPVLVRELTNWILSGAYIPCKEIAFSASIAILSAYKLFKVKTESGLKTNLYVLCVAGSGTGKTQALNGINKFFSELNHKNYISGVPASDAGLERVLSERKRIILWDEIGLCLKSLQNMSSYQSRVFDLMTQIYTMTDVEYVGQEYANADRKRDTIKINKPQISCFATTTYDPFFESLENSEITSGKYQRWLPFLCPEHIEVKDFGSGKLEVTPEIKLVFDYLKKHFPMRFKKGGLSESVFNFVDQVIPYTEEARSFMKQKSIQIHNGMRDLPEVEKAFYARIMERTAQLALTVNDNAKSIDLETVMWAYATTKILIDTFIEKGLKERFAETSVKADANKILKYVKNKERWVSLREITSTFRYIERGKRGNLIADLVDSEVMECKNQGRGKTYRVR